MDGTSTYDSWVRADGVPLPPAHRAEPPADPAWQAILSLRAENDLAHQRESWMIAAALTGTPGTLLGKPVIIRLEWPEGLPGGMTEDDLRAMGEKMLPRE